MVLTPCRVGRRTMAYNSHQKHTLSLELMLRWPCAGAACCQLPSRAMQLHQWARRASSSVSKRQLLPSSVTSFHHLRPTSRRPDMFFVCAHACNFCLSCTMQGSSHAAEPGAHTVQKSSMSRTTTMTKFST